jgi:hypothetical protein
VYPADPKQLDAWYPVELEDEIRSEQGDCRMCLQLAGPLRDPQMDLYSKRARVAY